MTANDYCNDRNEIERLQYLLEIFLENRLAIGALELLLVDLVLEGVMRRHRHLIHHASQHSNVLQEESTSFLFLQSQSGERKTSWEKKSSKESDRHVANSEVGRLFLVPPFFPFVQFQDVFQEQGIVCSLLRYLHEGSGLGKAFNVNLTRAYQESFHVNVGSGFQTRHCNEEQENFLSAEEHLVGRGIDLRMTRNCGFTRRFSSVSAASEIMNEIMNGLTFLGHS